MDIKSLILIAGGVMIVAVILHGIWIAWRGRRETIRMDIIQEALPPDEAEQEGRFPAELPNGGARVVGPNDYVPARRVERPPMLMTPTGEVKRPRSSAEPRDVPEPASVDDELFGPADEFVTEDRHPAGRSTAEVQRGGGSGYRTRANGYHKGKGDGVANGTHSLIEAAVTLGNRSSGLPDADTRMVPGQRARVAEVNVPAVPRAVKKRDSLRERLDEVVATEDGAGREQDAVAADASVISFYLMARGGKLIEGLRLHDVLKNKGIKYGEMAIFHRKDPGSKLSLYSVANAVNPGTFDVSALDELRVPGIVFFMQLEGLDHPVKVFEDMRRVATDVASALGCEIKDENRSVVTAQTFDHYRERIAEFARRRLSRRA